MSSLSRMITLALIWGEDNRAVRTTQERDGVCRTGEASTQKIEPHLPPPNRFGIWQRDDRAIFRRTLHQFTPCSSTTSPTKSSQRSQTRSLFNLLASGIPLPKSSGSLSSNSSGSFKEYAISQPISRVLGRVLTSPPFYLAFKQTLGRI